MKNTLLLKKLEGALEELQAIPLWGTAPPFPWEDFSSELSQALDLKGLEISHHKTEWLSKEALISGMGDKPVCQAISLSPIPGNVVWIMPEKSRDALIQLLLSRDEKSKGFIEPSLQEGFYHFILLNILSAFNRKGIYGHLSASLSDENELPAEGAFAIDISIKRGPATLWGRLLCPREVNASFASYFAMNKPPLLSDPNIAHLPVDLQLEIGATTLSAAEWKKLNKGDFILLDRCTYDLQHRRGTAALTLGNTPLFDVRIKEGEVKILEYALFQEEKPMTQYKDEDSDFEEDLSKMDEPGEADHLWSTKSSEVKTEEFLSSKKIPVTLVVEVGRLQMPLDQVTKLKPGNVLDLALAPLPNVHLTIGGKRVAKGELVQLGDSLGVKLINIGD